MIKTVYSNDQDIIKAILDLHVGRDMFDLDPTFSLGKFYKGIKEPKVKFDLYPQREDVREGDCRDLPLESGSVHSICFDPPFLAGYTTGKTTGIIGKRFEGFRYMSDVWEFYRNSIKEFYRILEDGGVLAFKCQDTVSSGKQWFSHCFIYDEAKQVGFTSKDLFIHVASSRMVGHNHKNQKHARKFHSYWWVFKK